MKDNPLVFNPDAYVLKEITVKGKVIRYRAWEGIVYVAKPIAAAEMEDMEPMPGLLLPNYLPVAGTSTHIFQSLNIYAPVPDGDNAAKAGAGKKPPILFRTYVGFYLPALPGAIGRELDKKDRFLYPDEEGRDFTPRALAEGYVVVSPGSRGSTSVAAEDHGHYIGRAPALIADLKAAIRYLRRNAGLIPGDAERIITDGYSAGGASSCLLALSGNDSAFEPYLEEIGAAEERDDVFAALSFCPITDIENSDTAYEWLYNGIGATPGLKNGAAIPWESFPEKKRLLSDELKALYPDYIDSLNMVREDTGERLTADNYLDYICYFLKRSAQKALDSGEAIPPETGISVEDGKVADIDFKKYLTLMGRWSPVKDPPSYDNLGFVPNPDGSFENILFADETRRTVTYTDWALRKLTGDPGAAVAGDIRERVRLMNAMTFLAAGNIGKKAKHIFLRHGAFDRDTSFTVPINLYTKLKEAGLSVDFDFGWGQAHAGDYGEDEAFAWIASILE